ncbi:MAG TPA: LytR C-terminal domain-containing protein [Conexibacter sp.]|jgi:hypothetical protein|nr:LytR C-terminal domain-containing protein [Conexibacter sp.]
MAVTLAFSAHSFVDKIGAYAGFAAAIGLALFAVLLFAQARELRHLREWGANAHDRIGELERKLAAALELARRAGAARGPGPTHPGPTHPGPAHPGPAHPAALQRTGVPAAARVTAAGRAGGRGPLPARTSAPTRLPLLPAAPAGVAGAALGSATVFVPLPANPPGSAPAGAPASASSPAAAPVARPSAAAAAIPAAAAAATSAAAPAAPAPAATPAPATAAGQAPVEPPPPASAAPALPAATNGHSDTFPPVPPVRRATPPARPGAARRPPARGPVRPTRPGAPGARPAAAAAAAVRARSAPSATPRGSGNGRDEAPEHGRRRRFLLLAGLGIVAVAAVAVLLLSGGGGSPPATQSASTGTPAQHTTAAHRQAPTSAAPAHNRTTVAVLNGTATPGLANTVATTLTSDGFVRGPVGNASNQHRSVTVVSYFGGHEAEAREVAKALNVSADAVQPIDPDTEAACASGATCTATVVVTVGADRH